MSKRMFWALGALMILIIASVCYIFAVQYAEIRQLEKELAEAEKLEKQMQQVTENDLPPAKPGYKWVRHGDHYHQAPIAEQNKPIVQPAAKDIPVPQPPVTQKLYTGPLTYHAELLKTNPVKALRLQQEERGHWSAAWIPPFPPEDTKAQEFARAEYLRKYYWWTYGKLLDTPEYEKESKEFNKASAISNQMWDTIMAYPYGARKYDLMKLSWPVLDAPPSYPGLEPSEYFGNAEVRDLLKQAGTWKY